MRINKMEVLERRLNNWNKTSIRPGPVGSVGDVNNSVRLKHSAPDLPLRWDKQFSGKNEERTGSNVTDGMWYGYSSGGMAARTIQEPLGYRQGFKTAVGWIIEDVRQLDTTREPKLGSLGDFKWQSQVASVKRAKVTGDLFLPLPGGYSKGLLGNDIPRGSQIPIIVAESEGKGVPLPAAKVKVTDPIFGENGSIENPQAPTTNYEYAINPRVVWTPPAGDARRSGNTDGFEFVKLVKESPWGDTYAWLEDSNQPQLVFDKSRKRDATNPSLKIANRTGGIQRPANEPVPSSQTPVGGRVPKPTPYEYGKPGDRLPVPGQGGGGPGQGQGAPVPGQGGAGQGGAGSGLQCRSGNCKGLFR